jgi:hypothetical protein
VTSPPVPDPIQFLRGGAFFDHILAYVSAMSSMEPLVDPSNPMKYHAGQPGIGLDGKVHTKFVVDTYDLWSRYQRGEVTQSIVTSSLSRMLIVTAYQAVEDKLEKTPLHEFFRHVRNASAHTGAFNFRAWEPSRPAVWRTVAIDATKQGPANPLFGVRCFYDVLGPADPILLLWDIEQSMVA